VLAEAYRGALDLMSRLIDSVERHSENHSLRVAESAADVARALGLPEAEVEDVRVGALLHDIGRLEIPAEALANAAGLTPAELEDSRDFGARGRREARPAGGSLQRVLPLVACRHERWDGTGRRALRGDEIPVGARIIAVADGYDGMVTDRAYRKGIPSEHALALLREASGTLFDPRVVEVFVELHRQRPAETAEAA
jgi:putative nucleotidyltransferase with HDIG domain